MQETFNLDTFIYPCNELFFFWNRKNRLLYWRINFPIYTSNLHCSASSMTFFLLPQTEKLHLFRHKIIYCGGLFIRYISVDMYWLPCPSVSRPICALNKTRASVHARASKSSVFSLHQFYFSFKKQTNINYNFFFKSSRFLLLCCKVGWLDGNDCCPISIARS